MTAEASSKSDVAEKTTTVEMSDLIGLHLSTITSLSISPTFSIGTLPSDQSKTLVPLASCMMHGEFGENEEPDKVRALLSLDNLAFLVMRLGEECQESVEALSEVSQGQLKPLFERTLAAAEWFEAGATSLKDVAERLHELSERLAMDDAEATPSEEDRPSKAKKKTRVPRRKAKKD